MFILRVLIKGAIFVPLMFVLCYRMTLQSVFQYDLKRVHSLIKQVAITSCVRLGSSWKRRVLRQEELKNVVFQYAGSNPRRAQRVYVWGCSATGALGLLVI